jgi:hypothetical protein
MTRLNLTWIGSPGTAEKTRSTFKTILIAYIVLIVIMGICEMIKNSIMTTYVTENLALFENMDAAQIQALLASFENMDAAQIQAQIIDRFANGAFGPLYSAINNFILIVFAALSIWLLVTMIRTRMYIRRKYHISAMCCGDNCIEDCCVSYWCTCCALAQMARHTADYENQHAACCSKTGLKDAANNV